RMKTIFSTDPDKILPGSDYITIVIGTEDEDKLMQEAKIADHHGFYFNIGDSYGFSLAARIIRTFSNFDAIFELINKFAPQARVINLSNPMSLITRLAKKRLVNKEVMGFCPGYRCLVNEMDSVKLVNTYGVNHCMIVDSVTMDNGILGWEELLDHFKNKDERLFGNAMAPGLGGLPLLEDHHFLEFFPERADLMTKTLTIKTNAAFQESRRVMRNERETLVKDWAYKDDFIPGANKQSGDPVQNLIRAMEGLEGPIQGVIETENRGFFNFVSDDLIIERPFVFEKSARLDQPEVISFPHSIAPGFKEKLKDIDYVFERLFYAHLKKDSVPLFEAMDRMYGFNRPALAEIKDYLQREIDEFWV
ncbi:MAG: hypothetical protein ABIA63_03070, partial [bacterium]